MSNEAQSSDMFSSEYHDLHMEPDFCDAVLQVQGVNFKVHKVILCKCSPYFGALFRRWSAPDKSLFEIPGLSPDMMQHILEFAYTGSVSVTETNVQELLLAADQLNVMGIVQTCYDFLGEHLCLRNCIGIWQFTNICCSSELRHKVSDFIVKHFEEIVSCEEFLQLSVEELTHILSRDDLNVRKESIVFDAINHWIAYIPEERERHMAALLSQVRLTSTDAEYIKHKVMSNKLVKSNPDCKTIASKALKDLRHSNALRSTVSGHINPFTRPRLPHAILLAMGGWSGGDPTNGIEAYDIRADNWINVTDQRERPRAYHGTAFLHGYVFCIGGFNRIEHFNSTRKFDPSTLTWHEAAPMHYRRCYVSVTVLDGCIYAMGGFDGTLRLNTAERYRPETNQWTIIAPMHEQRSDANCAALLNRVYICGGFNGNECLQTCEYYSPESNQWTMITPMSSRRSGIGVIAYADHVFAVGGFDGNNRLRSVEAYSPRTNTWQSVCSMLTPRSNFGIEVLEEQLFAVGGFNGFTTSYNVECYDALMDEWTEVTDMEIFRSALSCCVVSDIPNVDRFVLPRGALAELHVEEESVESGDSS